MVKPFPKGIRIRSGEIHGKFRETVISDADGNEIPGLLVTELRLHADPHGVRATLEVLADIDVTCDDVTVIERSQPVYQLIRVAREVLAYAQNLPTPFQHHPRIKESLVRRLESAIEDLDNGGPE